jgi:hypothetical protein
VRGLAAVVPFALAALALLPAVGEAATTCVGLSAPGCEATAPTIQAALDSAKGTPSGDRIVIGPGVFLGPFSYPEGNGGRIEVVGQGPPTVLTAPPGTVATTVLAVASDAQGDGSSVSNLTVRIPANTNEKADTGISADVVSNVRVASDANEPPGAEPVGVHLVTAGGALRNSVIELVGGGFFGIGVLTDGGSTSTVTTVADSRITAPFGVEASVQATSVVRSRVLTGRVGVFACNSPVTVEDSLVRVFGTGTGLLAEGENECSPAQASLVARQATIVGTGTADGQVGVEVAGKVAGQQPAIDVSLSVLRDLQTAFRARGSSGASATIGVGASNFEAGRHIETPNGGEANFLQRQPNVDADPLFAGELLSEFTLRPGSPAIDSSFSPPLAPGESTTDLAGNPRVADGNGDGIAARDMGAYEAPPPPDTTPPETTIAHSKRRLKSRQRGILVTIRFSSSESNSTFQCKLDAGKFAPCSSPFQKRLSFGHHRFEVRAIDAAGNVDPTPAKTSFAVLRLHRPKHRHKPHRAF